MPQGWLLFRSGSPVPEEAAKDVEIGRLRHEWEAAKAYLQSVIERQEGEIEQLRAANEELQSTNEALETAK